MILCAAVAFAASAMAQTASDNRTVDCGSSVTITATPAAGYHFVKWVDGAGAESTTNPLTVPNIKAAQNYTAHFAANEVNFGDGVDIDVPNPNVGDPITLTATPTDDCYQFKEWSDHNTENPRTITYTGTVPFTAVYEIKTYQVNVTTSTGNTTQGTVTITMP